MNNISYIKSSLAFAIKMREKYVQLFKEWQHNSINKLNDYCKGVIDTDEYCRFIRAYNNVMLQYEYWLSQETYLQYRYNEECKNAKFNNSNG